MTTRYYKFLENRNRQLCNQFITRIVLRYPTSQLSQDKIKAYRLLIHAEIEYFVESIVKNKVIFSYELWNRHKKINRTLLALVAYDKQSFPNVPGIFGELSGKNDLNFRLCTIVNNFYGIIKSNNGIKEKDMTSLLIRIGIEKDMIDHILMGNMNSFGSSRGELAHNTTKVHSLINPIDEKEMVEQIIIGLKSLDELVREL